MSIYLKLLRKKDIEQFILDNQTAFKYGAEQYFSSNEMEEQYEEEGEIISKDTIQKCLDREGSIAYRIYENGDVVGGIIVNIKNDHGDLEIFFINPNYHSKGIGQKAWKEIERLHRNVKVWETLTPCFEKRNIHFYVNKLGFHITAYYNKYLKNVPEDLYEMYQFQKVINR